MKGKHLVIGILLFVIIVVGLIYLLMMGTINKIKEEGVEVKTSSAVVECIDRDNLTLIETKLHI